MEGFMNPFDFSGASFLPTAPATDLAGMTAAHLAQQGIRPEQFIANPEAAGTQAAPTMVPGLGTSLEPQQPQQPTSLDASNGASIGQRINETLKGVQLPKPPTPQTVRTPTAQPPAPQAIKGGNLIALLQAMGAQGGAKAQLPMPLLGAR